MADSQVTWDLIARDKASATFGRIGRETETLQGKLKTLAGAAGLAGAGYAAVSFAKTSIRAFAEAQRSQTQLQDAYARFPAIASVQIEALRELNRALQAKTGFDDDALASGEAVLAQFKLTGEQVKATIPLVADYAARTGQDIPTAATNLGRAFLGNTRALKTLGISYKSTGDQAKDTANIIDLLRAKVGGFAEREGKTAEGRARILATEFQNVEEELGAALLPALTKLGNFLLHDVIPPLQKTADFIEHNKRVIEPLTKAVLLGVGAWKAYGLAVKGATAISALTGVGAVAKGPAAAAVSMAKPLPVYVTNAGFGAPTGGTPPVVTPGGPKATPALPGGFKALPLYGVGAIADQQPLPKDPNAEALFGRLVAIRKTLHGAELAEAKQFVKDVIIPAHASAESLQKYIDKFGPAATEEKKLGSATKDTTSAMRDQAKALAETQKNGLALSQSQDDVRQAIHNLAVTAGQSGRALRGNSDAALANRDALRGAVSSAEAYLQTLKQRGATAGHVRQVELNLAKAIRRSADDTYGDSGAVKDLLRQFGFLPGQIARVIDAFNALHTAAFTPELGSTRRGLGQFADIPAWEAEGKKAGGKAGKGWTEGATPVIADAANAAADAASAAFDRATQKAKSDAQLIAGYFKQTKQELISSFASISTETMSDSLGGSYNKAQSVRSQLREDARKMHQFARLWHKLDRLGLDPRLLGQFNGPDYIPAMQEILQSGRKGIRADNRLERQIARDAGSVAVTATADKYGRLAHQDAVSLPPKVEKGFERALRRNGITLLQLDRRQGQRVARGG